MGNTGEEWEIVEHSSSYAEESKMAWILDNGLSIGKRIVIIGVVISSTPIVLPPLVLISALGFALSVPSGILLSAYFCTEKLMSKLLPRPDYPLMLDNGTIDPEKEEFKDKYWEKRFDNEYQDLVEKREESGYEEDVGEYLGIGGNVEESSTKMAKEEKPTDRVRETKDDIHIENKDRKGKTNGNRDERDIGVTAIEEKTMINGKETDKKSDKKRRGNKKANSVAEQEELRKESDKEKVVRLTDAGAKEIGEKSHEDTAELHSSPEVPESKQTTAYPTGKGPELSEGNIREKIDALRVIVGYKASPHRTYIGELRALYMFTGIEPPKPFNEHSDLVELVNKLGFLMSHVGIK